MKKSFIFGVAVIGMMLLSSCEGNMPDTVKSVQKSLFSGKVQKGPFVIGSTVDIFELDRTLSQSGKMFATTISDASGSFYQRNLQLGSQFVELRASGFYFNEVSGKLSDSPLTLFAIADISSADNVNVNILTTLECSRLLTLVSEGKNFANAKRQAHEEVLALFGMTPQEVEAAEALDIESDAQLLVVSAIVQGKRSSAEITSLIASLAADLSDNGKLDDSRLASLLKNNALGVDADMIVANMQEYNISYSYKTEDVKYWLENFDDMPYEQTEFIEYPEYARNLVNILACKQHRFYAGENLAIAAKVPAWGSLKIEISSEETKRIEEEYNFPIETVYWSYEVLPNGPKNWTVTESVKDSNGSHQTLVVTNPGEDSEVTFSAGWPGDITFTFYENSSTPTRRETFNFYDNDTIPKDSIK